MPVVFVYGNAINPGVAMSASSYQVKNPPAYAAAEFRGVQCWAVGKTSEWLQATLAAPPAWNAFALIDANVSPTGRVEVRGSTDNFVTSDVQIIPPSQVTSNPWLVLRELVDAYRYLRIIVTDPDNPDGFVKFGKPYFGRSAQPSVMYEWGWSDAPADLTQMVAAQNGTPHFNVKPLRYEPEMAFAMVPTEDKDLFEAFMLAVRTFRPWLVAVDTQLFPDRVRYLHFLAIPKPKNVGFDMWSYSLAVQEVL